MMEAHTQHTHTESTHTDERNIYARIQDAYRAIAAQGFTKDGQVKGAANYRFISIGQILAAVRKAQADAGITVIFGRPQYDPSAFEKRWDWVKKGQYGDSTWYAAVGHISVRLYGRDADDCIETEIPFEAQDNSDKLTNKIITNAERTLYRTLYSIDEGSEDPEEYNIPMEPEPPAKKPVGAPDPFFNPKPKTEAPAYTNPTKAGPARTKEDEAALDRPAETKADCVIKYGKVAEARERMRAVLKVRDRPTSVLADRDALLADPALLDDLYLAGIHALKATGGGL